MIYDWIDRIKKKKNTCNGKKFTIQIYFIIIIILLSLTSKFREDSELVVDYRKL